MKDLLMTNLISHYNLPTPTITNWFIQTQEAYFEIEDTNGLIVLHTIRGFGMSKFSNSNTLSLTVINYEKFITAIQDQPFKDGRKRCDIILDSNDNRYLVLGEIKDRAIPNSKLNRNIRRGVKQQLLSSLQTILAVPEINTYSISKVIKRCCYFNKQSTSPATLSATTAFNRLPNLYLDGFKMSQPGIEALGFEFYEYTGEQTMILRN